MLDFIKEYGVTNIDYETIIHDIRKDILNDILLSKNNVIEVLKYFNSIGIKENISKIIMYRPDLVLMPINSLKDMLKDIDNKLLVRVINKDIKDLIIFGI